MLRTISIEDVRLGMFIHRLEGAWLDHPFWKSTFLLLDPVDLRKIRESNLTGVMIDTDKGADVEGAVPVEPDPVPGAEEVTPVSDSADVPRVARAPRATRLAASPPAGPCSLDDELDRASEILDRASGTVADLLHQARLGKAVDVARVAPVVEEVAASVDRNPDALISISRVREKDAYIYLHSVAVCALMINLARQLNFQEEMVREAGIGGLLHDFGQVAVPDKVLKKAGALTEMERDLVKRHPERGFEALTVSGDYSEIVADILLHHHERVDGSGYPHGLKGDQISIFARMAAICDVYDSITSQRPYKGAEEPARSLSEMFQSKGLFDEALMAAFIRSLGVYPVGSLVRLRSDRLALVVDQSRGGSMCPVVRVFFCIRTRRRMLACDLDLGRNAHADAIVSRENPQKWGFTAWETLAASMIRARPPAAEAA